MQTEMVLNAQGSARIMTACSKTEQAAEIAYPVLWCRLCLPGPAAWQPVRLGQDFAVLQAIHVVVITCCCLCQVRAHANCSPGCAL